MTSIFPARQALNLLNITEDIRSRLTQGRPLTTMDVFMTTRKFDATVARVKFYGLMGVLRDEALRVKPDYDAPASKLFIERTVHSHRRNTFTCLSVSDPGFSSDKHNTEILPSWVPRWSDLPKTRIPFAYKHCINSFKTAIQSSRPVPIPKVSTDLKALPIVGLDVGEIELTGKPLPDVISEDIEGIPPHDSLMKRAQNIADWLDDCEKVAKVACTHVYTTEEFIEVFWNTVTFACVPYEPLSPLDCIEHYH